MQKYPKTQQPHNFILWANDFHELAAVTFATSLRKVGLLTSIVGLFGELNIGQDGLTLSTDMDIHQALTLSAFAFTIVIPGELSAIRAVEKHPTARQFLVQACDHKVRVVVHESVYQQIEESPLLQRYQSQLAAYPKENVGEFSQEWARQIACEII